MDLTALETEFQTFISAQAAALVGKLFPSMSAANQADIVAILPHVESIVARTLGALVVQKIGTAVPSVANEVNTILAAVGVPATQAVAAVAK